MFKLLFPKLVKRWHFTTVMLYTTNVGDPEGVQVLPSCQEVSELFVTCLDVGTVVSSVAVESDLSIGVNYYALIY
jgi:hypothetical protein